MDFGRARLSSSCAVLAVASPALALGGCRGDVAMGELVDDIGATPSAGVSPAWVKADGTCTSPDRSNPGHVLFRLTNQRIYRLQARPGAVAEDLTQSLDRLSRGKDGWVNGSADGDWLLIQTSRFGCGDEMCVAVVSHDLCSGQPVIANEQPLRPATYSAIGSTGDVIVFPANDGPHKIDLFATRRSGDRWTSPELLTKDSAEAYNQQPALSRDRTHVLFDCGADPGEAQGMSICEVGTDGSGFRKAVTPAVGPGQHSANHHAAYGTDGRIVFEGSWNAKAEQIWQLPMGARAAEMINTEKLADGAGGTWRFSNDNSPCVLPDGRVVSLWLGRHGNNGGAGKAAGHELKMMDADGQNAGMLLTGIDVVDVGIGCTL